MRLIESGSPAADIWLIGEAPGEQEISSGRPFSGPSGWELDKMLAETGFDRGDMFLTNVSHERPPGNDIEQFFASSQARAKAEGLPTISGRFPRQPIVDGLGHLNDLLSRFSPRHILLMGNTPLWAVTGENGISKWRGSIMQSSIGGVKCVPTFHPAFILRQWELRNVAIQDLRRAKRESLSREIQPPKWNFLVSPSFDAAQNALHSLLSRLDTAEQFLSGDIETRQGQIACVGLGISRLEALCLPFLRHGQNTGYWSPSEELEITKLLKKVLTHPNARLIFQNGAYDLQYFAKQWGYLPRIADDTMVMMHTAFPGMLSGRKYKSLDFISSLMCNYYRFWKEDDKDWNIKGDEVLNWTYNCTDCVYTFECWETLTRVLKSMGLWDQYRFQMDDLFPAVLKMMLQGIRVDQSIREVLKKDLDQYMIDTSAWFEKILGHPLNPRSTPQMQDLFFTDLGVAPIRKRSTGQLTLDDEAMDKIRLRNPLLRPLLDRISDYRSAGIFSNVLDVPIPHDGNMRCTYNITGTETFRFSSSEDSFGFGTNLQNLSKGDE